MTLTLLTLLASRDYPARKTYVGAMEIGEFCITSVPDVGALFDAMETEVAGQGDLLLKQQLWLTTETEEAPYLLKLCVAPQSPIVWFLIPIAITAVAGAVVAWKVWETVQVSPTMGSAIPIIALAALGLAAIYLLK